MGEKMKLTSRKLWVVVGMAIAGVSIDLLTERGLSLQLKELFIYLSGTYIIGNGISRASEAIQNRVAKKEVDLLKESMITLDSQQTQLANLVGKTNETLSKIIRK